MHVVGEQKSEEKASWEKYSCEYVVKLLQHEQGVLLEYEGKRESQDKRWEVQKWEEAF